MMMVSACGDDAAVPQDARVDAAVDAPPDAPADPRQIVAEVRATPNNNLDLLFVVDDSPSMQDKQNNLAVNFPNFINVLNTLPGGLPNLHLGVVTTDMGTKGSEDASPGPAIGQIGVGGCSGTGDSGNLQISNAPVSGTFISDIKETNNTRTRNYTGTLTDAFSLMARGIGAGGCGFEQPLAAMKAALNNNPANAGFLRPDAVLGVVFVTDEDDCSIRHATMLGPESATLGPLGSFRCARFGVTCAIGGATPDAMNQVGTKDQCSGSVGSTYMTDIAPYTAFLAGLKGDTRNVVVGAIMGPTSPFAVELRTPPGGGTPATALAHSCSYSGNTGLEVADPGVRMNAFLQGFPNASSSSTICQQDLSGPLALIAGLVARSIGSPCLTTALLDVDPGTAGPQYDCIVEDHVGTSVTVIPACSDGSAPTCWQLQTNVQNCPTADHLELVVTRPGAPNPALITRIRCRVP